MADPLDAAEIALFDLLTAGVTVAPVFQHVPQDYPPNFVMIGSLSDQPMETKDDDDSLITANISAVFEGEERAPLIAALGEIKTALNGKVVEQDGWELHFQWISRTADRAPPAEGKEPAYVGSATFEITALTA